MKKMLLLGIISSSLIGILDSSFILVEKALAIVPPCTAAFKCGVVLNSSWSQIGPFPLAFFGFLFYATFFLTAIITLLHVEDEPHTLEKSSKVLLFLGVFGALFSTYLITIMGVVLKAWCLYCLISAVSCFILFATSAAFYLVLKRNRQYER